MKSGFYYGKGTFYVTVPLIHGGAFVVFPKYDASRFPWYDHCITVPDDCFWRIELLAHGNYGLVTYDSLPAGFTLTPFDGELHGAAGAAQTSFNMYSPPQCQHTWVNVGFFFEKLVCKHCDVDRLSDTDAQVPNV